MRTRARRLLAGAATTALVPLALLNACGCGAPLRIEPLAATDRPLATDGDLELAREFAPLVFHELHPGAKGRQDLPTRVDFDGDLRGDNNWESFPRWALPPTVYYAVLETATHWFIAYHLFHPRDWSYLRLGLHETHENDGENLQVVVQKAARRVVLLFTQAHYCGGVYTNPGSGLSSATEKIRGPLVLFDAADRPRADGRRAGVYVEWGGHGIYGLAGRSEVAVDGEGRATWKGAGIVLRPARPGERVAEPDLAAGSAPYQLESTRAKLWPGVRDGSLIGKGGLLDGLVRYQDARVDVRIPRFYEADLFSGPFGPDRGISPFALDFGWKEGALGALYFDPARRYAEVLAITPPWSLAYLRYPY